MQHLENVPEMIIVGISYNMRSYDDWAQLRELDFTIPEVQDAPQDSRADLFLAKHKQEIIPFIQAHYRVEPNARILYGYSSSGFFALYALCNEPDLFRSYIAGSGDTDLSSLYIPAHDQKLVSRENKDPIDLYLSVGSLEEGSQSSLASFNKLVAEFNAKNDAGVRLITEIFEGEKHGAGGAALTYIKGLQKCLPTMESFDP